MDTASVALAPRRDLSGVPSSASSRASSVAWSAASMPRSVGAIASLTAATA